MKYLPVFILICAVIYFLKGYLRKKESNNLIDEKDTIDERFNAEKLEKQKSIDKILEKVSKGGFNTLTKKEKSILDEFSKK